MGRSIIETLMGALVILVAVIFIFISYRSGNISSPANNSYKLTAKFREVGSIAIGSDVRVGGIKIGSVSNQSLDPKTYMAILELNIKDTVSLPKDTTAAIVGDGLLGGKYIALQPGGDDAFLKSGDEIKYTQDAVNIEQLIGKFAFGSVNKGNEKGGESTSTNKQ